MIRSLPPGFRFAGIVHRLCNPETAPAIEVKVDGCTMSGSAATVETLKPAGTDTAHRFQFVILIGIFTEMPKERTEIRLGQSLLVGFSL